MTLIVINDELSCVAPAESKEKRQVSLGMLRRLLVLACT